jgi:hypothetical protein
MNIIFLVFVSVFVRTMERTGNPDVEVFGPGHE